VFDLSDLYATSVTKCNQLAGTKNHVALNGQCYWLEATMDTQSVAKQRCALYDAHLAILPSDDIIRTLKDANVIAVCSMFDKYLKHTPQNVSGNNYYIGAEMLNAAAPVSISNFTWVMTKKNGTQTIAGIVMMMF
jgi:hypothetical protein